MRHENIQFRNSTGIRLAARLDLPADNPPRAYAVYAHCFTCGKDLTAAYHISRALTQADIAVLRFDFAGLGESEGDFSDTNFSSNVQDLLASADYLTRQRQGPRLLVGHSLGGVAVLCAADRIASVRAVVTIGAPSDPRHVLRHLEGRRQEIEDHGQAKVILEGRPFVIKKQFLEDLAQRSLTDVIGNLPAALLVMHSPLDDTVAITHAARIFQAARHPKSFVSLNRADHLLSDRDDARYVGNLIAAWFQGYLEETAP